MALIKFNVQDVERRDWDRCPKCKQRARHPLSGEHYSEMQDVLWCAKCGKSFIAERISYDEVHK